MRWTIRLAKAAENDFAEIVDWTTRHLGEQQALIYADHLIAAIGELDAGPSQHGVLGRDEIRKGLFTLHMARGGRKGRHFILFRVGDADVRVIDVIRILHDAMDLPRHLPEPDEP